ncbi:MAG: chorismate dehydratase [Acidobacteriota bacterium]
MTRTVRLGAVDYLNARPLVYGLELRNDLFTLRFDVPSKCAALLHEGSIDVGMIPSIEFLRGGPYRIVPGAGIISEGAVASVALFSTTPLEKIRTIAADTSSRTSNALLHVLCMERFGIDPHFRPMHPDPVLMLGQCDAALLIGDPALFLDHDALGATKIDLGEEWFSMTGLPFVWAFWAGRPYALTHEAVGALLTARDGGVAGSDAIATLYCGPERASRGQAYLRENIRYSLGEREEEGLRMYYELAGKHGLVPNVMPPAFYHR